MSATAFLEGSLKPEGTTPPPPVFLSSSLSRTNICFAVLKWNQFMASLERVFYQSSAVKAESRNPLGTRAIGHELWDVK